MSIFDRSERSTDAIANTACTLITISRSDFELLLDFNRDVAYKILWSVVRLLSARLRVTNDNLRSFLAMSMFLRRPRVIFGAVRSLFHAVGCWWGVSVSRPTSDCGWLHW